MTHGDLIAKRLNLATLVADDKPLESSKGAVDHIFGRPPVGRRGSVYEAAKKKYAGENAEFRGGA